MTDADRKLLTEKVLGECWHEPTSKGVIGALCTCGKVSFNSGHERTHNRGFVNCVDMLAIAKAIQAKGKWEEFTAFAMANNMPVNPVSCTGRIVEYTASFVGWLIDPERFCQLAAEWERGRG